MTLEEALDQIKYLESKLELKRELIAELRCRLEAYRPLSDMAFHASRSQGTGEVGKKKREAECND